MLRRNFRLHLSLLLDVITIKTLDYEDCRIIITADSICDILKIKENDFTKEMVKDISRYWDIVVLANK